MDCCASPWKPVKGALKFPPLRAVHCVITRVSAPEHYKFCAVDDLVGHYDDALGAESEEPGDVEQGREESQDHQDVPEVEGLVTEREFLREAFYCFLRFSYCIKRFAVSTALRIFNLTPGASSL